MSEAKYYSTKQTTEITGLSKDTLRYYEKIGILQGVGRDANNYRQYSQEDIDWLILVKLVRGLGINTTDLIGVQRSSFKSRRKYLEDYQSKLEREIKELQRISELVGEKISYLKNIENED